MFANRYSHDCVPLPILGLSEKIEKQFLHRLNMILDYHTMLQVYTNNRLMDTILDKQLYNLNVAEVCKIYQILQQV